jgi:hypothetical protein
MMAQGKKRDTIRIYQMLDPEGRRLGEVVAPLGVPRLGRGAGTVLLLRSPQCRERSPTPLL